jgi:hypothetical protein
MMMILNILLKRITISLCKHYNDHNDYHYSNDEWQDECKSVKLSTDSDDDDKDTVDVDSVSDNSINSISTTSNDNTNTSIIEEFNAIIETIPGTIPTIITVHRHHHHYHHYYY